VVASLSDIYLIRHGETEWSLSGQHTGLTNLPLTGVGEEQAGRLEPRLTATSFSKVLSSPLQRAMRTCELAGYGSAVEADSDLVEWNYGDYDGKTRPQILARRPGWLIFRDGCPNGESPKDVGNRAEGVLSRIRKVNGNVLVFSSHHLF
jgi:broad specificity phosphatase PhoE